MNIDKRGYHLPSENCNTGSEGCSDLSVSCENVNGSPGSSLTGALKEVNQYG